MKAFTLVETIIYAALISIVIGLILLAVFQIIDSQDRARSRTEVEEEANFLMGKIKWALIGTQTINQPPINATGSILSINKFNFSQNPVVIDLISNDVRIAKAGAAPIILNSGGTRITKLVFNHQPASSSIPESLKTVLSVEFNPRGALRIYEASTTLETTIYLRR